MEELLHCCFKKYQDEPGQIQPKVSVDETKVNKIKALIKTPNIKDELLRTYGSTRAFEAAGKKDFRSFLKQ